jgi:hypothetical protein
MTETALPPSQKMDVSSSNYVQRKRKTRGRRTELSDCRSMCVMSVSADLNKLSKCEFKHRGDVEIIRACGSLPATQTCERSCRISTANRRHLHRSLGHSCKRHKVAATKCSDLTKMYFFLWSVCSDRVVYLFIYLFYLLGFLFGIATRYGLESPGIELRWGGNGEIFSLVKTTLACIQWVTSPPLEYSVRSIALINQPSSSAEVKERVELYLMTDLTLPSSLTVCWWHDSSLSWKRMYGEVSVICCPSTLDALLSPSADHTASYPGLGANDITNTS